EWKKVQPMVPLQITEEDLARVKAIVVQRIAEKVPEVQPEIEDYLAGKLDVARTIEHKLGGLPKAEFERILRGVFEEDEITLILVGGFLGGAIGVLQASLVLGLN